MFFHNEMCHMYVWQYNAVDGNATLIEAKDTDKADTLNSNVVYNTAGVNKDILSIDPTTGTVYVHASLQ